MLHKAHPYYPFMLRAGQLAELSRGDTCPNPIVGALLVKEGRIVAQGRHCRYGGPHAEVEVLRMAERLGLNAAECTLVVTLEPCNHHGKTPPCTEAILRAGIKHVVIGFADPTKAGGGAAYLRARGVTVETGIAEDYCRGLIEDFLHWQQSPLPFVTLKFGVSLDGVIAARKGKRGWITGPLARCRVQELRSASQGVLVGGNTLRVDNPRLTCRPAELVAEGALGGGLDFLPQSCVCLPPLAMDAAAVRNSAELPELGSIAGLPFFPAAGRLNSPDIQTRKQPLAIVVSSRIPDLSEDYYLFQERPEETVLLTGAAAAQSAQAEYLRDRGVAVIAPAKADAAAQAQSGLSEEVMFHNLCVLREKYGCWRILCEGGAELGLFLLDNGLAQNLELHTAPRFMANAEAVYLRPAEPEGLPGAGRKLHLVRNGSLGDDAVALYSVSAHSAFEKV